MQDAKFLDAMFHPQEALKVWAADPSHKASLKPGMTWVVNFQLVFGAIMLALAWGLMLLLGSFVQDGAGAEHWALQWYSKLPESLQFGGMVAESIELIVSVVVAAVAPLAAAALTTQLLDKEGGQARRNQVYNVMAKMTLAWQILILIPVLGWIVMIVGIVLNSWRSLDYLFPGLEWPVRLRVFIAGGVVTIISAMLLSGLLKALLSPIAAVLG